MRLLRKITLELENIGSHRSSPNCGHPNALIGRGMGNKYLLVLGVAVTLGGNNSWGFGLSDHSRMTQQAVMEYNLCARFPIDESAVSHLVHQNLDEDINLFLKWGKYSHYFHPEKALRDLHRLDASFRIIDLLGESTREELGHALHLLQDMASPPHVVPVRHGLFDGFEAFDLTAAEMPPLKADDCRNQQAWRSTFRGDLLTLLDETALETLQRSKSPWAKQFWVESNSPAFGNYGYLGNSFGTAAYPRAVFTQFKARQIRLGIETTKKALIWAYGL